MDKIEEVLEKMGWTVLRGGQGQENTNNEAPKSFFDASQATDFIEQYLKEEELKREKVLSEFKKLAPTQEQFQREYQGKFEPETKELTTAEDMAEHLIYMLDEYNTDESLAILSLASTLVKFRDRFNKD